MILRCLEKEKDKRYQNASELRSELENMEKGIPTTERVIPARKPFTSREITVQLSPKKILIPALAFIALIIAGFVIWKFLPQKDVTPIPSDKPSIAIMYFNNNTWKDADPGIAEVDNARKRLAGLR